MLITCHPYALQFKYPFRIAHGLRTHTPAVYVKVQHNGLTAWGEATLPPYLPETVETVTAFVNRFAASHTHPETAYTALQQLPAGNMAARAALDMALCQLLAQMQGTTIRQWLGIPPLPYPTGTYTIGVSTLPEMKLKIAEAEDAGFTLLKLKLDGLNDEQMLEYYQANCRLPFAVDVNQGWKTVPEALHKIGLLQQAGCLFVEQPLPVAAVAEMKELKAASALPLYADESLQTLEQLPEVSHCFNGVNIKLMKCGGITPALKLIQQAQKLGLHILIGCMSESSVGCTAAAQLSPLAHYADLDGPYLINNDPFTGMKVEQGKIAVHEIRLKDKNNVP